MAKAKKEYVLGSSDDEIARLAFQHEVWSSETSRLWETAGISYGDRVADLGCGPGLVTLELASLVGTDGSVAAVDASEKFVGLLNDKIDALRVRNIDVSKGDVNSLDLDSGTFDFAFSRWLYCFLSEPAKAASEAKRILKPGGKFIVIDYVNYLAAGIHPGSELLASLFTSYMKLVNDHYGTYNIGQELPAILSDLGFEIEHLRPIVKIARPGEQAWNWVEMFNELSIPSLLEAGIWDESTRDEFESEWAAAKTCPGTFFFTPPMIGIVATKPLRG